MTIYTASSLPSKSATSRSSSLTVGSSLYTSSPTTAEAIARRISSVGWLHVSLRKSIILCSVVGIVYGSESLRRLNSGFLDNFAHITDAPLPEKHQKSG
ncbi:hypothetical protein BCAR13_440101 [Paraburkholderia caribensis]|nr:hypothetical protein BCAR13_440101 [Paraburkholderia caribensis]